MKKAPRLAPPSETRLKGIKTRTLHRSGRPRAPESIKIDFPDAGLLLRYNRSACYIECIAAPGHAAMAIPLGGSVLEIDGTTCTGESPLLALPNSFFVARAPEASSIALLSMETDAGALRYSRFENLLDRYDNTLSLEGRDPAFPSACLDLLHRRDARKGLPDDERDSLSGRVTHYLERLAFSRPSDKGRGRPSLHRNAVLRTAVDFVRKNHDQPIYVGDVSNHSGVSQKSLERFFKQAYGISIVQYIHLYRFNVIRKQLISTPATTTIASIAMDNGIWDKGRFSTHYRKIFGVLPSREQRLAIAGKP